MSEPTREEMIDIFDTIIKNSPILSGRYEQIRIVCDAIRRLIETRPRVTRDFVGRWAKILDCDGLAEPDFYILIEGMLCEAGIEMEEEK